MRRVGLAVTALLITASTLAGQGRGIEKGTFGVCRDCGEPIAEARLNAIPWTRVCITCKEKQKA